MKSWGLKAGKAHKRHQLEKTHRTFEAGDEVLKGVKTANVKSVKQACSKSELVVETANT